MHLLWSHIAAAVATLLSMYPLTLSHTLFCFHQKLIFLCLNSVFQRRIPAVSQCKIHTCGWIFAGVWKNWICHNSSKLHHPNATTYQENTWRTVESILFWRCTLRLELRRKYMLLLRAKYVCIKMADEVLPRSLFREILFTAFAVWINKLHHLWPEEWENHLEQKNPSCMPHTHKKQRICFVHNCVHSMSKS